MATGPLLQQIRRQFDDTPGGGIFDPAESTEQLNEALSGNAGPSNPFNDRLAGEIGDQFDNTPGGGPVDNVVNDAVNLGPDWLDEAAIGVVILVVIGVGLYLLRPLLTIVSNTTG